MGKKKKIKKLKKLIKALLEEKNTPKKRTPKTVIKTRYVTQESGYSGGGGHGGYF